jgi:hypothetical protein
MALRSFDSLTRLGIPRPSKAFVTEHRGEVLADEGTLIMEPAPISVVPSSRPMTIPPAPPSSVRPMMYSVPPPASSARPSLPSWDDRSGWTPQASAAEITKSTRVPPKGAMSARDRSASAMVLIATAAMLAALASIGFMHKASRSSSAAAEPSTAEPIAQPTARAAMMPATTAAPSAASISPPVAPPAAAAIDIDDEVKTAAPKRASTVTKSYSAAPASTLPATSAPSEQPRASTKPAKESKEKSAQQQKALEDLLEQLGEEQLKR